MKELQLYDYVYVTMSNKDESPQEAVITDIRAFIPYSYEVFIKNVGLSGWYSKEQLSFISDNKKSFLDLWRKEVDELRNKRASLDWIFENGIEVLKKKYRTSVNTLSFCFTDEDLAGRSGECINYIINSEIVLLAAQPYLEKKDKQGWLNLCAKLRDEYAHN